MAPLSTTAMVNMLKSAKYSEFSSSVEDYFRNNDADFGSAGKVVKTVSWYFYENSVDTSWRPRVIDCVVKSVEIIIDNEKSTTVIKEILNAMYHILTRLDKHDRDVFLLARLGNPTLRLFNVPSDNKTLVPLAYNLYGLMWNFTTSFHKSVKTEEEVVALVELQHTALQLQMLNSASENFSYPKLVNKVKQMSLLLAAKVPALSPKKLLASNLVEILQNPVILNSEDDVFWDLWKFVIDFVIRFNQNHVSQDLMNIERVKEPAQASSVLSYFVNLRNDRKESLNISISSSKQTPGFSEHFSTVLLEAFTWFYSEIEQSLSKLTKEDPETLSSLEDLLMMLCSRVKQTDSVSKASKIINELLRLELQYGHEKIKSRMSMIRKLLQCQEKLLEKLLEKKQDSTSFGLVGKLALQTYGIGCQVFRLKEMDTAEELIDFSCRWTSKHIELDPSSSSYTAYSRFKLLAEVQYKQEKYSEGACSTALAVMYLISSQLTDIKMQEKLREMSGVWMSIRVKWRKQEAEDRDNINNTVIHFLRSNSAVKSVPSSVLSRLLVWEIGTYRNVYQDGLDFRETTVKCIEKLLEVENTKTNLALVLMEQTLMFWLNDNLEDLETAVKYCEKAKSILVTINGIGSLYMGVTSYLRFLCEHRLLQFQILSELKADAERKLMEGRQDQPGVNEDKEMEDDGTPNFAGLELSVQNKLAEFLEEATQLFCDYDHADIGTWYTIRNLLDIQLAVALNLERFSINSNRLLEHIVSLSERFEEKEHLILTTSQLMHHITTNRLSALDKICELSSGLEDGRSNTYLIYHSSLSAAEVFMQSSRYADCEEILETILKNPYVHQNTPKTFFISAKAKYLASRLRYMTRKPTQPIQKSRLENLDNEAIDHLTIFEQGPVELALDAYKLVAQCIKYWEEDVRLPSRQCTGLLWQAPELSLLMFDVIQHLIRLYKHISLPRYLKAYIKKGLEHAQSHCLSLHTCFFLLELAKSQLLCDDEEQAFIQLKAVEDILEDLLRPGGKSKVNLSDDDESGARLPGERNRTASPLLFRQSFLPPKFIDDKAGCSCTHCSKPILHLVLLNYFCCQARSLMMAGELRTGKSSFKVFSTILPKLEEKYIRATTTFGQNSKFSLMTFMEHKLECLVLGAQSFAQCGDTETASEILASIKLPGSSAEAGHNPELDDFRVTKEMEDWIPTMVFKAIEIKDSLSRLKNASAPIEDIAIKTNLLAISSRFNEFEGQSTPTTNRLENRDARAPSKRELPSLGVGDPSNLAKDLEKLQIYNESDSPKLKPKRGGRSRIKLAKVDEFTEPEPESRKQKPKIIISEDTPRKFFKSKGPKSTPSKLEASQSRKVLSPIEIKSKKVTTKKSSNSVYDIYEDDSDMVSNLKTPAKSVATESTASTSKRSTRTSRKKEPESVKKPEQEISLKRSTRKATKRL